MKTMYVMLPCYNEAQNIGQLLEEWEKQRSQLETEKIKLKINVINDASTDNTKDIVIEKKNKYDNIDLIEHKENKGLCGGINTAVNYFNENATNGDLLVIMDGDNTQNPKYVHSMLEKINQGNDCVIASRYQEGAKVKGLAVHREKLSDIAKIYYEKVLNINGVKDYTCGYRIYTYNIINKVIESFGKEVVKEKSFACMMELLYKISRVNAKIDEVPFELRYDNKNGTSKMKVFTTMRRSITTAISLQLKYNTKNCIKNIAITVLLLLLPLFLSLITNYSPTNNLPLMHDCGIFSYIAYVMQNGMNMYVDAWDNKGPLLYMIYYIGMCLSGEFGVYLLEYISLAVMTIFGYKTIKLITKDKGLSVIGIIYSLTIWVPTHEMGTFSEVFALPFMMIGIYLFTKCILNNISLPKSNIILWGICCTALALLRLNILLVFLPLFIIIGITLLTQKRIKELGNWLLYGLIGFVLALLPMVVYLFINDALIECINTAYLHIMSGFASGTWLDKIKAVNEMLITLNHSTKAWIFMLIFMAIGISLLILKLIKNEKIKILLIGSISTILINLYANGLSGAVQMHYFITFIPVIILMSALTMYVIQLAMQNKKTQILSIFAIMVIMFISVNSYIILAKDIKDNTIPAYFVAGKGLNEYIIQNTEITDKVQMIGGRAEATSANYITKRFAASRYSYLPLWDTFTKERKTEIVNEVVNDIVEQKPKLICMCLFQYDEFNELIIQKEEWKEFITTNYVEDNEAIFLYKIYSKKQ